MEGNSNETAKNEVWQNIRRKEGSKCTRPKGKRMPDKNGGASTYAPGRKYTYFARRVSSAMLRIPTTQPLLIPQSTHSSATGYPVILNILLSSPRKAIPEVSSLRPRLV